MRQLLPFILFGLLIGTAAADEGAFSLGPVFTDFGPVADIDVTLTIPAGTTFKHSFDVSKAAEEGALNRSLVSVARFINMHARAGVDVDSIHAAIVVHGNAVTEMADKESGSAALVAALTKYGVKIIVCGQSAAYYDVATDDLLPGVTMALSAMTAHALLQQQGYTLNPF